jgi:hypothetical protein
MSRPFVYPEAVKVQAPAQVARTSPVRSLRRFATWFSALLADDGFSDRFAAERSRDEGLVRRVERQRPL